MALRIEILPPWWGTWWFRVIIAVLLICSALAVYYYRLRQLEQQFHVRLGERLSERTRIARELHDSLLQGFQGLMFRLQAVRDMLPARPGEAMAALETALDKGDQAIAEGREAVQDLRSSTHGGNDLVHTLTALGEELASTVCSGEVPTCRVLVEGKPRVLDAVVRDEVYRVAREALRMPNMRFEGLMTYPTAKPEQRLWLERALQLLNGAGIAVPVVSGGGSPTLKGCGDFPMLTEYPPTLSG